MTNLELRIPPLAVWAIHAVAIAAAAYGLPFPNLPIPGHRSAAVAVALFAMAVALAGIVEFRKARTTVNPLAPGKATKVVATGVFRLTRNPMYLGMAAGLLALVLWWASLPGLALVVSFCVYITRFQILPEERALLALFGEAFGRYMSRVRRWI